MDLVWSKTIDRTLVQTTYLRDQICTLLNELTLGLLIQLMIQLALEFFKLDYFSMLYRLDTIQCGELVLCLSRQLGLNILNKGIQFLDSVLFRLLNFLDRSLYLTDIVFEVTKPATQTTSFSTDQVNMLLVNFLKLLERMLLMLFSKKTTV